MKTGGDLNPLLTPTPEQFLNIVGIWAIKFSFLAFFRRLGHNVRGQKLIWWVVTVLTIIALAISVGVSYYPCIFATFEFETSKSNDLQ